MSAPTHNAEALRAFSQIRDRLASADPLDGISRATLWGVV